MIRRNPGLFVALLSLPFILCVLVLTAAALGRVALIRWVKVVTHKEPIALRKPLAALDKAGLGPYQFVRANQLTAAVEEAVGTEAYLDWHLIDTSVKRLKDPRRFVRLFITYYTGGPNLAPHTPDVCYIGGGYQAKQAHADLEIDVPALGESVPIRVCTFTKTAILGRDEPTVIYTFNANGEFKSTGIGVRNVTHRIRDRYAYYSKVEISFGGEQSQPRNLSREESVEAAAKLFNTVLPLLVTQHWPDWEALTDSTPDKPT
ncbi:MAG: exosortase-associated EpsI family protein [Planctomycetota bacterium]